MILGDEFNVRARRGKAWWCAISPVWLNTRVATGWADARADQTANRTSDFPNDSCQSASSSAVCGQTFKCKLHTSRFNTLFEYSDCYEKSTTLQPSRNPIQKYPSNKQHHTAQSTEQKNNSSPP